MGEADRQLEEAFTQDNEGWEARALDVEALGTGEIEPETGELKKAPPPTEETAPGREARQETPQQKRDKSVLQGTRGQTVGQRQTGGLRPGEIAQPQAAPPPAQNSSPMARNIPAARSVSQGYSGQVGNRGLAEEMMARQFALTEEKLHMDRELKAVGEVDPQIRGLEDIASREEFGEIFRLVKQGCSLSEAYKLANFDRLSKQSAERARQSVEAARTAARQEAMNSLMGRNHLQRTTARGDDSRNVPVAVLEEYRALNPRASEGEIRAHYNRYLKETGQD